ncbi:MAG: ankyrin repeat domain-containing protein [Alphaproteobacteria bacterium]|nr:ankyrin repeat domain-containing protein [Alphaproteobacteria bacterium]
MRVDEAEMLRCICIQKSLGKASLMSAYSSDLMGELFNPALLQAALKVKNMQAIQEMIRHKSDLNAFSMHGYTPLMMAAMSGCTQGVKDLVLAGADVDLMNKKGQTALWLAASNGYADIVKMLSNAGADLNVSEKKEGKTPLMVASEFGHLQVVSTLIKLGADVNKVSPFAQTALSYGIVGISRDVKILKRLVAAGANICEEPQSENKRICALKPLILAVVHHNKDAVKFLLSEGASGQDEALKFALSRKDGEMIDLFEKAKSPKFIKKNKIQCSLNMDENIRS